MKMTRINIRLTDFIIIISWCSINGAIVTLYDFTKKY